MLLLGCSLRAADLPAPVTLDVPIPANKALPTWLGTPSTPATVFATLDLPISTPDTSASMLVTVYFQEKQGGFMRILWKGTQGAQVLSDNFYENIGMSNQRSLLISSAVLADDGTLEFQCGDQTLGIQRIKLEWLASKEALVSPQVQDLLVTPSVGPTQPSLTLDGQAQTTQPGAWQNQLVSVPITDGPERIEQGVDFSIDLDQPPGTARLALEETGLPLGQHLIVWINEQRAGTITPEVPDLLDGGFIADTKATPPTTNYVGWRSGSFYVPVSLLVAGINTIQFSTEDELATSSPTTPPNSSDAPPLAIKNVVMQLDYTPAAGASTTTPVASAPPTFLLPQPTLNTSDSTGPITPADSSSTSSKTTNP